MDSKTGLLLEGGALRSIFTAGVLDFFMEKEFYVPNVVAVSAGAYVGMNYISHQYQRALRTNVDSIKTHPYLGLSTFLKTGELFDMELLFDRFPNQDDPFDYQTFLHSDQRFLMSTVNCYTGKPVYFDHFDDGTRLMQIARASNSLPLISKEVVVDGIPMLDGGMYDAIPIEKALEEGLSKIIVVFTRTSGYRKVKRRLYMLLLRIKYHKYPEFIKMVMDRPRRYNDAIDTINELEKQGRAFVIRPIKKPVKNNETNPEKLRLCYQHGYECAKSSFDALLNFLKEE
ncbi:MAG: patatin family protein [Clostridia bacterium]|nr:patatin family protein [Clostridia bacterium]